MKLKFRLPFQCGLAAAIALTGSTGYADSILRSAGNFALLGGTGITSTGTAGTTITNGNVGLSPAATSNITGFLPAAVINGAIVATGPVTAQARLDLIKAQAGLAGMPSNANMSTVDLGGKTLEPGVYTFNSDANLNGNLVLDDNQINAKGGPGGSDWSGGLMFDRAGRVVSIEKLSFNYSGRKNRVTDLARGVVKGEASANATTIQWRSNQRKWRTVRISNNDRWSAKIGKFRMGGNRIRLRADDADGDKTAVQRLTVRRVAQLSFTSPRPRA